MDKIRKILHSNTLIYTILFVFCIFLCSLSNSYDFDLYARLIVGSDLIEKGVFNYYDYLSYTPTHEWFDHEWGSGVIFYIFLKYFGAFGLIILQAILMFFTAFFIIKTQRLQKHSYPTSLAFMACFLGLYFHQNPNIVRCHLFSFMFFALTLYMLEKVRKKNSNLIWAFPVLVIFWNNLHGGVVSGLGLIFIYLLTELISKKPWRKYLYVLLVSAPMLVINPYGVKYLSFLFSANTMTRKYIAEWWNVFFAKHFIIYYSLQFFIPFFVLISYIKKVIKTKQIDFTKFIILLVTLVLGGLHVKLLSLTLIVFASLYYNEICQFAGKNFFRRFEIASYVLLVFFILWIPALRPDITRTNLNKFPVSEVEFLKINNIKGNLLTSFSYGSYASYKLYPNNLIYMDGRYEEVYNEREFLNLGGYELGEKGWEIIYKFYPTDILMPFKQLEIYKILENSKDWVKVYEGSVCGIFLKRENVKKAYKKPTNDIKYYTENEFRRIDK